MGFQLTARHKLLLVLALALCLVDIVSKSITFDEAHSFLATGADMGHPQFGSIDSVDAWRERWSEPAGPIDTVRHLRNRDVHPPLYFAILSVVREIMGSSLIAARSLSLLFGILALWAMHSLIGSLRIDGGGVAIVLFALSNVFVSQSTNARAYALAMALLIAAGACALRALEQDHPRTRAAAAGALAGMALITHYMTVFCSAALFAWLLWIGFYRRRHEQWLAAGAAFVPFFAVGAWMVSPQLGSRPDQFEEFQVVLMASSLAKGHLWMYFGPIFNVFGGGLAQVTAGALAAALIGWCYVAAAKAFAGEPNTRQCWALIWALAFSSIAGVLALSLLSDKSLWLYRYTAMSAPFSLLLLALGALRIQRKHRAIGTTLQLTLGMAFAANTIYMAVRAPESFDAYAALADDVARAEQLGGLVVAPLAVQSRSTAQQQIDSLATVIGLARNLPPTTRLLALTQDNPTGALEKLIPSQDRLLLIREPLTGLDPNRAQELSRELQTRGWSVASEGKYSELLVPAAPPPRE